MVKHGNVKKKPPKSEDFEGFLERGSIGFGRHHPGYVLYCKIQKAVSLHISRLDLY
jgi:hypothetical protein